MTILVTGSAGHLGEALMRTLRGAGRSARGIDIKDSPFTDRRGSICDRTFIRECRIYPRYEDLNATRRWRFFPSIDRVYVNDLAVAELGWRPKYDFRHVLDCLRRGTDFRSALARDIGSKGYHATPFEGATYPAG